MRAPFPLALRIGTDIIETSRILCPLKPNSKRLTRLAARFLHDKELEDLTRRFPDWRNSEVLIESKRRHVATWIAGRWAAKEAAKKAWDATLLSFRDLRVETEVGGAVHIICDTAIRTDDDFNHQVTEQVAQVSISHDGDYTIAAVIATPLHQDIKAELTARRTEAEAKVEGKYA